MEKIKEVFMEQREWEANQSEFIDDDYHFNNFIQTQKNDIITSFDLSKREINELANQTINKIINGEVDTLDIEIKLKKLEDLIKIIRKNEEVKDIIISEAAKYGKSFKFKGCEIKIVSKNTNDYSNDDIWNIHKKQLKEREELLKDIKEGTTVIDSESGEILYAPVKKYSEYLQIKY